MGSVTRSFFGPMILVDQQNLPMIQFADKYRLLLFSIADFVVGIALLYLFYHQGMILVNKEKAQARGMQSFKRIQDNEVKETALQARYRIRKAQEQALAEAAKNNEGSHDESAFYNSVMAECDHRSGAPTTTSMNFDNHNKRDKDVSKSDSKKLELSKGHFKIQCDSS